LVQYDWFNRLQTDAGWNLGLFADPNFISYFNDVYSQGLSEHGVRVEPSGDILERTNLPGSSAIKHVHDDLNSFSLGVIPGMKLLLTQSQHESPSIASANVYGMNLARTENYMYGDVWCNRPNNRGSQLYLHQTSCLQTFTPAIMSGIVPATSVGAGAIQTFQANQAERVVSAVNPIVYELNS